MKKKPPPDADDDRLERLEAEVGDLRRIVNELRQTAGAPAHGQDRGQAPSVAVGAGATSEAMRAVEASLMKSRSALPSPARTLSSPATSSTPDSGPDRATVERWVAQAVETALRELHEGRGETSVAGVDPEKAIQDAVARLVEGPELERLVAESLRQALSGDNPGGLAARAVDKALDGRKPEDLIADSLKTLLASESAEDVVQKAVTKAFGKPPEELVPDSLQQALWKLGGRFFQR